jgi:RNA polymerase sigma-70 factor, ECF subfamily
VSHDPCDNPAPFDPARELAFVQAVLAGREPEVVMFEQRMLCVPRMLGALNRRRARPLQDHDLSDLVQDTILIVLRKLHEFRAVVQLEGWLYRLCYLEFLNAVRRRARQREQAVELGELPITTGPDHTGHDHDDLYLALEELGGAEAEVIRMKYFTDLSYQEIAELLAEPANTIKTRYHRAMTKLTERLNNTRRREERAG